MTIRAAHFSGEQRMTVRQIEFTPFVQVTLEAAFRGLPRVDDRTCRAATLHVSAARPMTGLATDFLCMFRSHAQARMSGIVKPTGDSRVTLRAFTTANKFSSGDLGGATMVRFETTQETSKRTQTPSPLGMTQRFDQRRGFSSNIARLILRKKSGAQLMETAVKRFWCSFAKE